MESDSVEGSPAPQSTSKSVAPVQLIIGGSQPDDTDNSHTSSQHDDPPQQHGSESPSTNTQHGSEFPSTNAQHGSESPSTNAQHGSESPPTNAQHGSESPPSTNAQYESESLPTYLQQHGSESMSTARDLIRPSSLPTRDADVTNIGSPVVIKHHLVDSGSSAPNSPTPGKGQKKKAKKKKRHSSKLSPKSSPLGGGGGGSHVGVTSPLTNQIGPAVSSSGGGGGAHFPSMSQLVSEISSLNNPAAAAGGGGDASGRVTSSQIDTEMMQIDSILRALNTGTFDDGNMATIQQLTAQRPQVLDVTIVCYCLNNYAMDLYGNNITCIAFSGCIQLFFLGVLLHGSMYFQ